MSLELKNIEMKVGVETYIHQTSLKLEKNTINILLGSTLAGKTTLMQIMAGLLKPTNGEIWFNEKNVTGLKVQERNVSMVYQQFINYPNFSVYENIASPLKITGVDSKETGKVIKKAGKVAGAVAKGAGEGVKAAGKAAKVGYKMASEEEDRLGK